MSNEALKQLVSQGLSALKSGSQIGSQAAADIETSATNPELKAALREGSQTAQQWSTRIDNALQQVGGGDGEENAIVKAHYEVGNKIRTSAPDDYSRDLGIIASGQLALHYWIAAFGTMHAYLEQVGETQAAQDMKQCAQEAGDGDKKMTELAMKLMK